MAYARNSTRNTSGLHPNLRGLGQASSGHPVITPQQAMQQAQQGISNLNPAQFQNSTWMQEAYDAITSMQYDVSGTAGLCGSSSAPNVHLFQTVSGLALGTTSAGIGIMGAQGAIEASTAAIAGAATLGVGVVVAVVSMIFAHHAAAVAAEQHAWCAVIPAVNNAFSLIQQAVRNGTMTPEAGIAALDQVYTNYLSYAKSSGSYGNSPWCNALCEAGVIIDAIVMYWQGQYNQQAQQQAAAAAATAAEQAAQTAQIASTSTSPTISASQAAMVSAPALASGLSAIPAWGWFLMAGLAAWAVL